jgi:sigma-B regulation protein RsbU (phosphoserine phosphatase)
VHHLGSIPIVSRHSVLEARGKMLRVANALTADEIKATRLGIAVSELARQLLKVQPGSKIEVGLADSENGTCVVITHAADKLFAPREDLHSFFSRVSRQQEETRDRVSLTYPLAAVDFPGPQLLEKLCQIVRAQSRDVLMSELKTKNRELEESFENLQRTTSAKERMESELNIGRDIQMSMLPVDFDAHAHRHEYEIFATLHPAREVGGDFYDFFLIDEDRLCVCVGDVSGKGVGAALFMAMTKTLIKSRATNDFSPASILTHVNDELGRNNDANMFVTIWAAIVDVKTGATTYTNAGHNPPFLLRTTGDLVRLDELHGPVVAAMEGMSYGESSLQLGSGDLLILYTDGVTEAMNAGGELYGERRLKDSFSTSSRDVRGLVARVVDDVWRFQGDAVQADDVTAMAVAFHGAVTGTASHLLELRMINKLEDIGRVVEEFGTFAAEHGLDDKPRRTVNMALDELLNNVVSYAYDDDAEHWIDLRIELDPQRLAVTVEDEGAPFNPFARAAPDTTLSIEERQIGGLGIHLVKKIMDEASYVRRTHRNVVTIVKHLTEPTPSSEEHPE